ncbi:MAG TPA: protein-L-isoaspartate(D-aspartate) O-methyltransferase, partial [Candidatus Binataceae bacterium]|nr:protein-L-isoaspartate(D-aspartate) O-methyltransferase [Candidatus Binataceae bacterium]
MQDLTTERLRMVRDQIAARGVRNPAVLEAMKRVPREAFLANELGEFAYQDTPLPIEGGQTISQPYIVALMIESVEARAGDRALEIGTGSGYAAAVLAEVVDEVYTVERREELASIARRRLAGLGYAKVSVLYGDGTLGWPEHAPYNVIVVTAGGPQVPKPLLKQLAIGGRLIIPVGTTSRSQRLIRVTRTSEDKFDNEDLGDVQFVPLIGAEGWRPETEKRRPATETSRPATIAKLIRETAEPISDIDEADISALLERIGGARIVLLGEATHGTSEFYRMRSRITKELILRHGFNFVAVEADWPDAARINQYVRDEPVRQEQWKAFARFPTWMWRNHEALELVEWLRAWNAEVADPERRASFHGLDLYSLFTSINAVISYLSSVDPAMAATARRRYACLSPWEHDPAVYGKAVLSGQYQNCEAAVVAILRDMLSRRIEYSQRDGDRFFDAAQNARLVAAAERYYRAMYYGSVESWNLRDQHMFDTLAQLLEFHGPASKGIVWEHNSHVGDASATEMGSRGEYNVGQLARSRFAEAAFLIGFGTDHGTVAAASDWDGPMEIKRVRPSHEASYEHLCHDSEVKAFMLHLKDPVRHAVRDELEAARLERAIGVVYRPDTELMSHYFQACLSRQFDEYIWFDETRAVSP